MAQHVCPMPTLFLFRLRKLPVVQALLPLTVFILLCVAMPRARGQQLSLLGLRTQNGQGQFNGLKADAAGNLYTLLEARDGVRLLKFDPTGATLLGQAQFGSAGDQGVALASDTAGNIYVAGTSLSTGSVSGTGATAFPARSGDTINSFLAKFTPALTEQWLTFLGSGKMAVAAVDAGSAQVVVTGGIFAATLPVTSNAIQPSPLPGSTGDGFVQGYSTATGTLNFSTYLTGANGDTQPSSVALDTTGNAYVAGTTSATGFPTVNALVPIYLSDSLNGTSGFLAKLTSAGDAFIFSTYVPGNGILSAAYDTGTGTVLLSGDIARGLFPLTVVTNPIAANVPYQTAVRIAADGSNVPSATLLAPATTSAVTPAAPGLAVTVSEGSATNLPLLPYPATQTMGTAAILQLDSNGDPLRDARVGGIVTRYSGYSTLPALTTGVVTATDGSATAAGSISPTISSSLLATQRFDLPLVNAPTGGLPNTVRDAVPTDSCSGSACAGGAGVLVRMSASTAPQLAFSVDNLPNVTLRNLGATDATGVALTLTGYTDQTTCGATLPAGGECDLALYGSGPGTITVTSGNATPVTTNLPATTAYAAAVVVSPKELDFGVNSAASAPRTRTLTITNLGFSPQTFASRLTSVAQAYTVAESASDCIPVGDNVNKTLPPNSTCHITLALTASADPANDAALNAAWTIGTRDVALTGYVQAAALSVSATHIGFGRQYNGGLRVPRYLYLSNGSDAVQAHTAVSLPSTSPFTVTDACPATLAPQSVCRITLGYNSLLYPSADSTTLTLDGGITVLIDGQTLPAPSVGGATGAAPSLSVTPASITFASPVVVTTVSNETQLVTIQNTGMTDFPLTTAVSGDFTASVCPATLTAGSTCTVTVQFTPSDSGTRQGLLSVTAGTASPVYVTLTGQGTPFLATTNGTIAFGEVPVGVPVTQWFKVGKPFPSLTVSTASANYGVVIVEDQGYGYGEPDRNSFQQSATHSCSSCYVGVQFLPTATGPLTATLTLGTTAGGSSQTTELTGTGRPTSGVIFTPSLQSFGSVSLGSSTPASAFVLTNATGAPLTTSAPTVSAGDISLSMVSTGGTTCGATLAVGESCVTAVQFQPSATGNRAGQLTIATGRGPAVAALNGVGTASAGIAFAPDAFVFTNVPAAASSTLTTTVTNSGSAPVVVGMPTASDSHFTVTTNCATVAAGASCTITVVYTPTPALAAGLLTVPVTSSSGSTPQTTSYQLPLTGTYTLETAGLQIVPGEDASVHFGALATGSVSAARVLRVNNLSGKSLTVSTQLPRQFPLLASTCGALAPGASCTVTVAYAPLTNGDALGTLFVQGVPIDGTATLDGLGYLEGYGLANGNLIASGNFSPAGVLDFGQVSSGSSSTQIVTLTNKTAGNTAAPITIRRIHADSPFQTVTTCGASLAVNGSCTVSITYAPSNQVATGSTSVSTQSNTGVITVESDVENAPLLLDVSGSAVAVQSNAPSTVPLSVLAISQGALTFGTTSVGTASAAQALTLSNAGTTTIHVGGVLTTADFTESGTCTTLNPGDSCTVQIAFTPQTAGVRSGALELQTDAAQSLEFVSLLGTGTPASVSLAPTTLDFGSLLLGRSSTQTATFMNSGTTPVTLSAITVTGDYAVASATTSRSPCAAGLVLAAAAACTVDITFSPVQIGTRSGTLRLTSDATALPLATSLTGIGTEPQLSATPNGLAFGGVQIGSTAALSLTLANISTSDVNQLAFTISGDFSATSTCGPGTLTARSSCAITVTFAPTQTGTRAGVLTINSSDPSAPLTVPLTGSGTQGGGFILTANGAAIATATEPVAIPASYALALTPTGGFTGAVALTCTPQGTYAYITCSISPSTVTLGNGTQAATATITTVTGVARASMQRPLDLPSEASRLPAIAACLLAPCVLLVQRRAALRLPLLLVLCSVVLCGVTGCGSGVGDKRIRYGAPGTYQFIVTASSTTGVATSQSVTLNLTITQ